VVAEIDRIREAEISADELSLAVSYLDGVFPIRYETTSAIARALAALIVYELPEDYFDSYRSNIRSVSREEVLRVARAHLHPEALQILVVGDPSVVRGSLEEAGFGQLSTHQP
jgi:predicted Zn-dependent peptidase